MTATTPSSIRDIEASLDHGSVDARRLYEIWELRQPVTRPSRTQRGAAAESTERELLPWLQESVELSRLFVRRALATGEFLLACDAAREALGLFRSDVELQQSLARALVRLGSVAEAQQVLRGLETNQQLTARALAETLCLIGDIFFGEALGAESDTARAANLRSALESYRRASVARPNDIPPRLQAACAALLIGKDLQAETQTLATNVLRLIDHACAADEPGFALLLARAKAVTVLGCLDEAKSVYRLAAGKSDVPLHELAAARKEARLLAHAQGKGDSFFDDCFPPLQLIVFSGHMPDPPDRWPPRFPAAAEEHVRGLLRTKLDSLGARVGFASAAPGSDLLFLEEMLARGGAVHVVLPWPQEAFLQTTVVPHGATWEQRFREVVARASSVRVLGEAYQSSDTVGLEYASAVMCGLARLTARALQVDLLPLAVWDGLQAPVGGTASFVEHWRGQAVGPEIVHPGRVETAPVDGGEVRPLAGANSDRVGGASPPRVASSAANRTPFRQEIKTMLFGDIVGYSKLSESLIPDFVRDFLGLVSRLVSESEHPPTSVNTWGDAIYFVFDRAASAGLFALELTEKIAATDWFALGLFWEETIDGRPIRRPLSIRIGLHSGPVFSHFDPVVRRLGFTGAHVSRAARIEPITEPGKIFVSEPFAALAAFERAQGFVCDFAGTMPLAKKYPGEFRIYRLRVAKPWPLELLARVIHEEYCRKAIQERGETPATNPSVRAWDDLPDDLKASNREQAADIPEKLRRVGYQLQPSMNASVEIFTFTPGELEILARPEHDRWCESLQAKGWTYGPGPKNPQEKTHPCLVPWEQLSEVERDKDRDTVRNIPKLISLAGFRVRGLDPIRWTG